MVRRAVIRKGDPMNRYKKQAGFSYLLLLCFIAWLGIHLSASSLIYSTTLQRQHEQELLSIGKQFRKAIQSYYETRVGGGAQEYPTSVKDLLQDNRTAHLKRHLRKIFVDPMTRQANWGEIKLNGRLVGVYSLSKQTPIKQSGFDSDEAAFVDAKTYSDWVFIYPINLVSSQQINTLKSP